MRQDITRVTLKISANILKRGDGIKFRQNKTHLHKRDESAGVQTASGDGMEKHKPWDFF